MPNSYASYAYSREEYAGPPVPNSPIVETNQGLFPVRYIEIAPGYGPNDPNPVWVDISSEVTQITTKRGRQHTLGKYDAGEMRVTIDNKSGRYSPFNPSSPYYNQIKPGMPIRFRALWGAVIYPRFSGFVESWPLTWPAANDSVITVAAVDATKFLNLKKATSINSYSVVMAADAPIAWYRLNDAVGSTTAADSSGNGRTLTKRDFHDVNPVAAYTQAYYFQNAGALIADTDASLYAGHNELVFYAMANPYSIAIPGAISLECWVKTDGRTDGTFLSTATTSATPAHLIIGADNSGNAMFWVSGFSSPTVTTLVPVADGRWHHVVGTMTADANEVMTIYVDGVQYGQLTVNPGFSSANTWNRLFVGGAQATIDVSFGLDGAIDEAAVYNYVLTPAQVLNHYNAGAYPRRDETTGARIAYLASYTGIPAANQNIDTGLSTVQGATDDWLTKTILQNMQDQETTENGDLFIDAAGELTFFNRTHTAQSPYSQVSLVLGDAPLGNAVALQLPGTSGNYASTPDSAAVSMGNRLSANHSGFETSIGSWSGIACAVARTTAQFRDGAASMSMTASGAGSMSAVLGSPTTNGMAVTPGQTCSAIGFSRADSATRSCNMGIQWWTAGGSIISTTSGSGTTNSAAGYTVHFVSGVAPATAAFATPNPFVTSAGGAGEIHYWDTIGLVDGTGDLTLLMKASAVDWTPAAAAAFISHENPSTQRSYYFANNTTGLPFLRISPDGSSSAYSQSGTVAYPFADGTVGYVAIAWRMSDGRTQFFTSTDGTVWSQLGADRTTLAGAIFDSTALLTIGARGDTGANDPWNGSIYWAEVRSGLATLSGGTLSGGTVVARFDATKVLLTGQTTPITYTNPTTGETWTVNGSGWSWAMGTPEEPYRLPSLSVPYDDADVINEVIVTPAGMAPQIASDPTSQTTYGKRTKSISTLSASASDAATRAAAELALYKTAVPRVDSVTVNPADDPTMLFGPVLGSDLLTRIELRRRPMDGSASMFDQIALIEGIEDRVTKATWETTWRLSSTDAL